MSYVGPKSKSLQQRALEVAPLGVNSNFRYWGEAATLYMERAKGAYLWDVDGKRYIDYRLAFGPIILGHSYEEGVKLYFPIFEFLHLSSNLCCLSSGIERISLCW